MVEKEGSDKKIDVEHTKTLIRLGREGKDEARPPTVKCGLIIT
jgi:hypothetical protein